MPPCGLWLAEDGIGKVSPWSVRLVADVPGVQTFVPLIVARGFPYGGGVEAPVAIVHHRDSHRNLAWRPIPQPRQTGSPEGGCCRAGEVLRKSTRGNYGKRVSRTTQKTPRTAHRTACRTSPLGRERGQHSTLNLPRGSTRG